MPNVPCRLADISRVATPQLSTTLLANELKSGLDFTWSTLYGTENIGEKVCDGIATYVGEFLANVIENSMVQNVMGSGQVLGFAPPHVTVGQVMGKTLVAPGFIKPITTRPDLYQ